MQGVVCGQGKSYDEFDLVGLNLTEEQKKQLRELKINIDYIVRLLMKDKFEEMYKNFELVMEELNKKFEYFHIKEKKKSSNWRKKKFYE